MDILSNPEMLSKISSIAQGVAQPEPSNTQIVSKAEQLVPQTKSSRADLLLAIKPFLKEEKRGKIDSVIKALTIATTVSKLKGGGNVNV